MAEASVGVALFSPEAGIGAEALQIRADAAMYAAKRAGGSGLHVLAPDALVPGQDGPPAD